MQTPGKSTALAQSLAIVYTLLVIYASLHPFTDWRGSGAPLFDFLTAAWPRYYTRFDIVVNILAYMPLGFVWMPVLRRRCGGMLALILIFIGGTLLSGALETIQNFLPTRVPSNIDLACNSAGALLGALMGARWGTPLLADSRFQHWRHRHLMSEPMGDYGLVLIGIWLLIQASPENLLFGNGDLRQLLDLPPAMPFAADRFVRIEAAIAALGSVAIGLLLGTIIRLPRLWHVGCLILTAAVIRSFATALLVEPDNFGHWITPGNLGGTAVGLLLLWPTLRLHPTLRQALAAVAVLGTTALVNLAPPNPYLEHAARIWHQGHFLNFNGLTHVASICWPFLAMAFLMLARQRPPELR